MRRKTTSGEHHQSMKQASSKKGVVDHDYTQKKNITCLPPTQLDPALEATNDTSHDNASKKTLRQGA